MDFFEHQDRARRKTWRLIVLFAISVILIILAINFVVHFLFFTLRDTGVGSQMIYMSSGVYEQGSWGIQQRLGLHAAIAAGVLTFIGLASVYRIAQLQGGGDRIARELGAVWVDPDSADPQLKRLCNVVEEMSLASGVPIPHIYVLNEEKSINALAAGYSYEDAVVVVSRGALNRLTRDELQGVVAHEFTHILNGDMRMNIRIMGLLFGLLAISEMGRFLLYGMSRGRGSNRGAGIAGLLGLALWILGYIGVFFGRVIRAGVSRQREFLADASAVQFTRNPGGIAGALKKIGGFTEHSHVKMVRREEVSHMFFAEGQSFSLALMATHPPLVERIRAIEPDFQPEDMNRYVAAWQAKFEHAGLSAFTGKTAAQTGGEQIMPPDSVAQVPKERFTDALRMNATSPDSERLDQAGALLDEIPEVLVQAARRQDEVEALLVALLLGLDANKRDRKLLLIWETLDSKRGAQVKKLLQRTEILLPGLSMPLLDLSAPTLRDLPVASRKQLVELVDNLQAISGHTSLLAYCFARLLRQRVRDMNDPAQAGGAGRKQPAHLRQALIQVFSVLALHGHASTMLASEAFGRGMARLLPKSTPAYVPPKDWVADMDSALGILDQLNFEMKEQLIQALVDTAAFDGYLTLEETELLRLICACLHVPVPPVLPSVGRSRQTRLLRGRA